MIKSANKFLITLASVFLFGFSAEAARTSSSGLILTANAYMYNSSTESTPGANVETTSSIYDLKVGYLMGNGLYLGGVYTIRRSESNNVETEGKAAGASLGYVASSGMFIQGHYLAVADLGSYQEGSGYQVDLGYLSNVTGPLLIGVELTYRSMNYKKDDTNASVTKIVKSELMPLLTLGFVF